MLEENDKAAITMAAKDRVVSIHPYFEVEGGKLDEFKEICEQFVALTAHETKCLYYGFSFHGNTAHCREAYEDAAALLEHLDNISEPLGRALNIAKLSRLEIHGIAEELLRLKDPLADLSPSYFTLEYAIRR